MTERLPPPPEAGKKLLGDLKTNLATKSFERERLALPNNKKDLC